MKNTIAEYYNNIDMFTGEEIPTNPIVEHILEVNVCDHAWGEAQYALGPASGTRSKVKRAVNSITNLNLTTRRINDAKKGPFIRFMNRVKNTNLRSFSLEECARASCKHLVDDGTWDNIDRCIAVAYESMIDDLNNEPLLTPYSDELSLLVTKMKLNN